MREVIIPVGDNPVGSSSTATRAANTPGKSNRRAQKPVRIADPNGRPNRRYRDFLVRYEGNFIGHYHSRRTLTPRMAFGLVARQLRAKLPDFTPAKLALYRPIKLKIKNPSSAEAVASEGAFLWFGENDTPRVDSVAEVETNTALPEAVTPAVETPVDTPVADQPAPVHQMPCEPSPDKKTAPRPEGAPSHPVIVLEDELDPDEF